jgi:hypothetical protein
MLCVHLGPGRLGLGLVIDTLLDLQLEICVVGAAGREPPNVKTHEVDYVAGGETSFERAVQWVANPVHVDDLDPEVVRRLGENDPVAITGSMAHEAPAREAFLRELLERRPKDAETIVLACENEPAPMYARVLEDFPHIHYCASVVDRIVNWNIPAEREDGSRRVVAHPIAEWVIYHPEPKASEVLTRLDRSLIVRIVRDEHLLAGYRKRRQWGVNGMHLFMALITKYNEDDVPLTLNDDVFNKLRARVMPLVTVVLEAIEQAHPDLPYDPRFVDERLKVFRQTLNSTTRILEQRLLRADLRDLMRHFDTCIGAAAREAHGLGMECDAFEGVVELLVSTIDRRSLWFDQPAPDAMSPRIDNEVIELFRHAVARWMDPVRARAEESRLIGMLSVHRNPARFPPPTLPPR